MQSPTFPLTTLLAIILCCICTAAPGQSIAVPQFDHIVIVVGENTGAVEVYGNPDAPYINALASNGAMFVNSYALFHPSQPDYLAFFSGNNQEVTTDTFLTTPFTTPNLGRELIDALKTFTTFSEGLPSVGFNGQSDGNYVRKHNPAANWMGIDSNQIAPSTNQPFTAFPTDYDSLPSVALVIPDLCGDGHNLCEPLYNRVQQFDTWIQNNLDGYKQWCKEHNSLLIVTYDEDNMTAANQIPTVFYGAHVATGIYDQTINHYNVLRTLEDAHRLATHAGNSSTAQPIIYCWQTVSPVQQADTSCRMSISAYPNPFTSLLNISVTLKEDADVQVQLYDLLGRQIYDGKGRVDGPMKAGRNLLQIYDQQVLKSRGMLVLRVTANGKVMTFVLNKADK